MKVKAIRPLSVNGKLYPAGAVLELEDGIADKWLPLGFVKKAEAEAKPKKSEAEAKPKKPAAKKPAAKK